jgi:hypothetical protein
MIQQQDSQMENLIYKSLKSEVSQLTWQFSLLLSLIRYQIKLENSCNEKYQKCIQCRLIGIKQDIETQDHIFRCKYCPKRSKLKSDYFLKLSVLLKNHQTNESTIILIAQNVKNWFNNNSAINVTTIAPDATKTSILASTQQNEIGWDHWAKGRWSQEWATLQNYNKTHQDSGKIYATSKIWAQEIISLTWELIHQIWLERNNTEHDLAGSLEIRSKRN